MLCASKSNKERMNMPDNIHFKIYTVIDFYGYESA